MNKFFNKDSETKNRKKHIGKITKPIDSDMMFDIKIDNKKTNFLLFVIIALTFINVVSYFMSLAFVKFYIPVMLVVFVLLSIYNTKCKNELKDKSTYVEVKDKKVCFYDNNGFTKSIPCSKIKTLNCKSGVIRIELEDEQYASFQCTNSVTVFEDIKNGIIGR